jgi:hypothetical protein
MHNVTSRRSNSVHADKEFKHRLQRNLRNEEQLTCRMYNCSIENIQNCYTYSSLNCVQGNHTSLTASKSSPLKSLGWSREFQEVKVPRLHDNGTGRW